MDMQSRRFGFSCYLFFYFFIFFEKWRQEVGRPDELAFFVCVCVSLLVEVERVAVEVGEHVVLKHLLVAVQRELLAAHGADLPVALHVLLKLALVVVGREDDLAQRTPLHVHAAGVGWGGWGGRGSDSEWGEGGAEVGQQKAQAG